MKTATTSKTKMEKVDAPVLVSERLADGNTVFRPHMDAVPLDGVRVRTVMVTHPSVIANESRAFDGRVCWYGCTEDFRFEVQGNGPFVHRRILFQSATSWPFQVVSLYSYSQKENLYKRGPATGLDDKTSVAVLRKLLERTDCVRDLLYSKVQCPGVHVIEDRCRQYESKESGVRRTKKFFNGLGKNRRGVTLKYQPVQSGGYGGYSSELLEGYQHVYVVDIFQFGMKGLDATVPSEGDCEEAAASGGAAEKAPKSKRVKVESDVDMPMSGVSSHGVNAVLKLAGLERVETGKANIASNLKLYWYPLK